MKREGRMFGRLSLSGAILFCGVMAGLNSAATAVAAEPGNAGAMVPGVELPDRKPESRLLRLRHHWTGERLEVVYRIGDDYQPEAMAEIDHFMRDWRCDKTVKMDPRLIDRLYELQKEVGENRTIRLISAYRSEGYNASLLLAGRTVDPNSQHMFGRAADVFVPGLPLTHLKDFAETQTSGGTGYYPFSGPRFVHLDTGPMRHWTEMDPAERRRQGLHRRQRTRLKLDCSLTMAEALQNVPVDEALDALPQGAAVASASRLLRASFSRRHDDKSVSGADHPADSESDMAAAARAEEFCTISGPLSTFKLSTIVR